MSFYRVLILHRPLSQTKVNVIIQKKHNIYSYYNITFSTVKGQTAAHV